MEQNGFGRARIPVASYMAPKVVRPGKPPKLLVKRSGRKLTITWAKTRDAGTFYANITLADGRKLFISTKKRKVTVPAVGRNVKASVSIAGVTSDRLRGKFSGEKLKARARSSR